MAWFTVGDASEILKHEAKRFAIRLHTVLGYQPPLFKADDPDFGVVAINTNSHKEEVVTLPTKVTKEALTAKIANVNYVVMPDGRTTICQLTMQNGFTVRGESSCVSVENFNQTLGEECAYAKALDAAWGFEGYLLAEDRAREARGDVNQYRDEQEEARREFVLQVLDATRVDNTEDALHRIVEWRNAYTTGSFGWALMHLKANKRVARHGWNGKGMWLCNIHPGNAMHKGFYMQPCIGMKTADGKMQPGWLASQADMLAEDWVVVE